MKCEVDKTLIPIAPSFQTVNTIVKKKPSKIVVLNLERSVSEVSKKRKYYMIQKNANLSVIAKVGMP